MASITSTGIGSGLDINGIIDKLMAVERKPLDALDQQRTVVTNQVSALGQVRSALSTLQSAVQGLQATGVFNAAGATVDYGAGFTASAKPGTPAGSYQIGVQQLAQAQRLATSATSEFDPSTGGSLQIQVGDKTSTVNFSGGTLEQLRDAINAADAGVRASVVFNGSVKQLVLTGAQTGTANAFSLTGTGALEGLSFNPNAQNVPTDPNQTIYRVQAAQNAQLSVDGIALTRPSNTVDDVIPGVTLQLRAVAGEATLTVSSDTSAAKTALQNFVNAYNQTVSTISSLSSYDPQTQTAAVLNGDSTVRSLQQQLRQVLNQPVSGGAFQYLAQIGVSFDQKGVLTLDTAKLDAALAKDPNAVARLVQGDGTTQGVAGRLSDVLDRYTRLAGLIDTRVQGLSSQLSLIDRQKQQIQSQLDRLQETYQQQFNAMDKIVGQYNSLSTYLTQQFKALSGASNG